MFFANFGYTFNLDESVTADGAVLLCSAMPAHQLNRRKIEKPHLVRRLFDPQLYLAGLEPGVAPKHCVKLATYPWFGAGDLPRFDSGEQRQSEWTDSAVKKIRKSWPGEALTDPDLIAVAAKKCVDFQRSLGTWAILLPSPLTIDFSSDYSCEMEWLDAGLRHVESLADSRVPVFATVAISDTALRLHQEPQKNPLLGVVLDQISARPLDGVYLVVEQSTESADTRQCNSARTLRSLLYLVHQFSGEAELQVGVNFVGAFGLVCEAAGASWWASNWYKSLHRLRLADKLAGGQVFPLYWSGPAAFDINLESDFDLLASVDLKRIADPTPASAGLLDAARKKTSANRVPAWRYAKSNRIAPINHYLQSAVQMEATHSAIKSRKARFDHVQSWLASAEATALWAASELSPKAKTKLGHVSEWHEAFTGYRRYHSV